MRTKNEKNIILTGFMGTGKTTVGKLLAEKLNRQFVDTDELIEEKENTTISEIFKFHGEAAFRKMESRIAAELGCKRNLIISTGGRMMLDSDNVDALTRMGKVFCLIATPEEILSRIESDTENRRPLLEVADPGAQIVELLEQRKDGYHQFEKVVTSNKTPEQVTQYILDVFLKRK